MNTSFNRLILLILTLVLTFLMQAVLGITAAQLPTSVPTYDPGRIKERIPFEENIDLPTMKKEIQKKEGVVITKPKEATISTKFKLNEVIITGVTIYQKKDLFELYKSYLHKNVSIKDLQSIANAITMRYHQDGYMNCGAYIPPQKITPEEGIVRIQVQEAG